MKPVTNKREENLTSIDKALYTLDFLCTDGSRGVSLKELSCELGFNKSTTYRILKTLREHGFARQDPESRKYKPGLRIVELGERVLEEIDIRKEAHTELRKLSEQINEVVHLGIIEDRKVVYLDKFNPPERVFHIYSAIGKRAPIHCTGLGKAILAFLPSNRVEKIIKELELRRHTSQTITSPSKLREELRGIRETGYAFDNKEHEEEVKCVAVPIMDHKGESKAAISVTVPSFREVLEDLQDYIPEVQETARRISEKLRHGKNIL